MTRRRFDKHGTEFGNWLRQQPEIDSSLGFIATNIDYMWTNYHTGFWMLIEEKRHDTQPRFWQQRMFKKLDLAARNDPNYRGFHLLVFEHTNPDDGAIWLDGEEIDKAQLLMFLQSGFATAA